MSEDNPASTAPGLTVILLLQHITSLKRANANESILFFFCLKAYFFVVFCIVSLTQVPGAWIFFGEGASMPQAAEGQFMASVQNFMVEAEQSAAPQVLDVGFEQLFCYAFPFNGEWHFISFV